MKILFVWTGLTSYMTDCWRNLAVHPNVSLKVVITLEEHNAKQISFKATEVLAGIDAVVVKDDGESPSWSSWNPDVMFVVGWRSRICRKFVLSDRYKNIPKVCCFDMPWRWKLRCLLAPVVLWRFLRQYNAAFVPGAVSSRYARWLGFGRIYQGLFGIDVGRFRGSQSRDDYFLYIGRNSAEKRLDVLSEGHRLYMQQGGRAELRLFGKGLPGGFVSPQEVPGLMQRAKALVLASDFDPWPLVLIEAMSAGCPVIASDRCANYAELGKNWLRFPHGDAQALCQSMLDFEKKSSAQLECEARENVDLAWKYDCASWTNQVMSIAKDVKGGR